MRTTPADEKLGSPRNISCRFLLHTAKIPSIYSSQHDEECCDEKLEDPSCHRAEQPSESQSSQNHKAQQTNLQRGVCADTQLMPQPNQTPHSRNIGERAARSLAQAPNSQSSKHLNDSSRSQTTLHLILCCKSRPPRFLIRLDCNNTTRFSQNGQRNRGKVCQQETTARCRRCDNC
jgi:hypothetical protein